MYEEIYTTVSLSSYVQNDPVEVHTKKLNDIADKKRKLFAAGSATGNLCVGGWVIRGDIRFGMSASQGALPSIIWGEDTIKYMAEGNNAQKAIDKAIKNGLNIGVFPIHEKWTDIGRPEDYFNIK